MVAAEVMVPEAQVQVQVQEPVPESGWVQAVAQDLVLVPAQVLAAVEVVAEASASIGSSPSPRVRSTTEPVL